MPHIYGESEKQKLGTHDEFRKRLPKLFLSYHFDNLKLKHKNIAITTIKDMRKIGEKSVFYYEKIKKGCGAYEGIKRLIILAKIVGSPKSRKTFWGEEKQQNE